ncbi:MAG TPA: ABC transporter permease subunit [Actinomycetota bacterium]|nr:ABC transporter permease subunit [Actinomycetota bacterium]
MSVLLAVEIRRILSRRAVFAAAALVLLGMLIAGSVLFVRSHRPAAGELRAQQQRVEADRRQAVAECASGGFNIPKEEIPPGMTQQQYCEQVIGTPEIEDPSFRLVHYREIAENLSGLFVAVSMILAASFIGAEWHAGTITTQLTWESRRNRLLAAKAIAVALFAVIFFVLAQVLLFGVLAPAALFRGTTDGVNLAWLQGAAGVVLRGAAAAALASAIAFAVASIARNTAAAVGAIFVYMAVLEPLMRAVRPKWQRWYLYDNLATFTSGQRVDFTTHARSVAGAAVLVSLYALAFLLLAMAVFRRRDVT